MHPVVKYVQQFLIGLGVSEDLGPLLFFLLALATLYLIIFACRHFLVRSGLLGWRTATFYMFISPWLIGFVLFTLGPMIYSVVLSFQEWDMISPPRFVGLANYVEAYHDPLVRRSLQITFTYAFMSVPVSLISGFAVSLLMNVQLRGIYLFRTLFYLPSLVSGIPQGILFTQILSKNGVFNQFLSVFGITGPAWVEDPDFLLFGLIVISFWNAGGAMIIYLAGLSDIPVYLYEAAEIDGANSWHKFRHITLPQMSPVLFFNLVTGLIGAMQVFDIAFSFGVRGVGGGPTNALRFFVLGLWQTAFRRFEMGYASAQAWILFVIIMVMTALVFKSSSLWVFYETEVQKGE